MAVLSKLPLERCTCIYTKASEAAWLLVTCATFVHCGWPHIQVLHWGLFLSYTQRVTPSQESSISLQWNG